MPENPLGGWSPRKHTEEPVAGGKGVNTSSPRTLATTGASVLDVRRFGSCVVAAKFDTTYKHERNWSSMFRRGWHPYCVVTNDVIMLKEDCRTRTHQEMK